VAVEVRFVNIGGLPNNETGGTDALNRKCIGHQAGLFAFVARKCADRGAGAGFAARIRNFGTKSCSQPWFDEGPCPHVLGFFLAPNVFRAFWEWLEHFAQLLFSEWIKLFNSDEGCIINLPLSSIVEQIVINLTRAEDDSLDLGWRTRFG